MSKNIKPRICGVLCSIIINDIYSKRSNAQPIAAPPTAYENALSGTAEDKAIATNPNAVAIPIILKFISLPLFNFYCYPLTFSFANPLTKAGAQPWKFQFAKNEKISWAFSFSPTASSARALKYAKYTLFSFSIFSK